MNCQAVGSLSLSQSSSGKLNNEVTEEVGDKKYSNLFFPSNDDTSITPIISSGQTPTIDKRSLETAIGKGFDYFFKDSGLAGHTTFLDQVTAHKFTGTKDGITRSFVVSEGPHC